MAAQVKASRFTQLMSSLERFKTNKFLCDFTVKVGTKSFPAHRNILAASSEYFEALFLSNMKEVQDGFIDMKDVEPNAIEFCIEFMYTGEAKITMTTIQDILRSSDLLQLDDLTDLCFEELEENISPQNSLFAIYLAQMYNRHDLEKHAEQTVIDNFHAVISTPMFPSISKSDFLCYMKASHASYQTKWKAVIEWTNGQEGNTDDLFPRLLALLDIQNFPVQFTLDVVLRERLVKKSKLAKHLIMINLFCDVEKLETNLDISNCFVLKNLAETHQLTNLTDVSEVVRNFLAKNFKKIAEKKEFLDMDKQEFITLIQSPEVECPETFKYEVTVRWVKRDPGNRKKTFLTLFKIFKLDEFSLDYLKENVRTELLVKEFEECNDMMMNELFSRAATARAGYITPTPITAEPLSTQQQQRLQECAHIAGPTKVLNSPCEGGGRVGQVERRGRGGPGLYTVEEDEVEMIRRRGARKLVRIRSTQQQRLQHDTHIEGPTTVNNCRLNNSSPLSSTATAFATKLIPDSVFRIGAFGHPIFLSSTAATTVEETPVQQKTQSQTIDSTLKGTLVEKKKTRAWTCSLCYVRNPATAMKCVWCETPNPTAPKAAQSRNRGDRGSPDRTHYGYDEWYQD